MKTSYNDVINAPSLQMLLTAANAEGIKAAHSDTKSVLLVIIDAQDDFMPGGSLAVPNADADMKRLTKWMYDNLSKITQVAVSIDTHNPFQIFHPCWWEDKDGNNPPPFTAISLADLDSGKWIPVIRPQHSREYVTALGKSNKKVLVIWPYHCLQGTVGAALTAPVSNMVYFHSVARKSMAIRVVKGTDPDTEMYGIIKPEWDPKNYVNLAFVNKLEKFDRVVIAGEAKSHCVLESISQMLDYYKNKPEITKRVYILDDCMSSIPGFEASTDAAFKQFKTSYQINIVASTEFSL